MEIKELKKLLQQPYKTDNWKELLSHVFDHVQFLSVPQIVPNDDDRIKELKQYGTVQLSDNKNLALFELTLNDNVNLIRNRVGLNEVVKKYIDQDSFHGILSVFEQGKEDYRFTFTARDTEFDEDEGFIDKDTDTKRFTYILGKNESCRTAAERFDQLSKIEEKNLKAVEDAFNVEKLSKSFFNDYVKEFDKLVAYIKSKPTYYQAVFEKEESAARNYVKKFMGRLVFLKFIQKKGWLGVPVEEKGWKNGDFNFLENQYKNCETKSLFVSQFLNPLFYEALNVGNRKNDEFQQRGYKIPYLSGGLFENENPKDNRVDFDEQELNSLFDFFERYNFTIDENDVNDKEVGIDPEMLGHIFENLLEDNKDKGAFYTPKEIVRYMCQESLKEYLKTYLEKAKQWPEDTQQAEELHNQLSAFVEKKETAKMSRYDVAMATALRDVKICDPAIGSGAFPMGLLNEIFMLIKELHHESPDTVGDIWKMKGKTFEANTVKLNIIQNSIYGVDIEPGAVDIARLRFWLSLIIEEDEPKPLPHLDYKIVVGNSLVSKLDDTIIDIDWELTENTSQTNIFGNEHLERRKEILNQITAKQKEVFKPNSQEEQLSLEIRNLKIDLISNQLELMIKTDGLETPPNPRDKKQKQRTEKWLQTKAWKNQINKLTRLKKTENDLDFFDWKLDFPEVMNPEINAEPGFDIVIGNPPYIDSESMINSGMESDRSFLTEKLESCKGNWDIYIAFFDIAFNMLNRNGNLIYITPDKWLSRTFGSSLRQNLLNNFLSVLESGRKVFKTAKVDSIITHVSKLSTQYLVLKGYENKKFVIKNTFSKDKISKPYALDWLFSNQLNIIYKLERPNFKMSDFFEIESACATSDAYLLKEILFDLDLESDFDSTKHYKVINTGTCDKYLYKWGVKEMKYLKDKYLYPVVLKDDFNKIFKNSYLDKTGKTKLITKGLTLLDTSYDKEGNIIPGKSTIVTSCKNESESKIEFALGLLNSKVALFYIKEKYSGSSYNTGINFNKVMFQNLFVPDCINHDKVINEVNLVLNTCIDSVSEEYLNKIDDIFYKLYDLTYEEALIVEPELAERLSKEAYNALEI
ncbi:Eco57I restriction-modification methylase domain-containing protein [Psychroflexus planctonicus]|uniref:site-specific DNA-methyltransferase (adenine-specific) n=1 Tax=Psychroflexus planctonicus TaxID=1526575 RepID=A0ABQ1SKJ9_9FLAO|nr:Eco57I restriction-modification methylase domain-containing protein [Psychroflexus planctonicus]GGE44487.1 hypothetical protein GCM10010832_25630 [Psychroflexus planctonicus]